MMRSVRALSICSLLVVGCKGCPGETAQGGDAAAPSASAVASAPPSASSSAPALRCASSCDVSTDPGVRAVVAETGGPVEAFDADGGYLPVSVQRDARIPGLAWFWGTKGGLSALSTVPRVYAIYACCLHRPSEGVPLPTSQKILGDLGWEAAAPEKRIELAKVYDEVVLGKIGGMGETVVEPTPEFGHAHPFAPPEAHARTDGGVVLTHWTRPQLLGFGTGRAPRFQRWEIAFGRDGADAEPRLLDEIPAEGEAPERKTQPTVTREAVADSGHFPNTPALANGQLRATTRTCYAHALGSGETFEGKVKLSIRVLASGAVEGADVSGIPNDAPLAACMKNAARRADFGQAAAPGVVTIVYALQKPKP